MENEKTSPQLGILKEYEFLKTPLMAGINSTGEMIALRPCVENLGLDWSGQLQVIKKHHELNQLWSLVKAIGSDGKSYDMVCFPPKTFQDWLWALNPKSENFNVELWEEYKKGLVVYLLMMLKMSLDEIERMREREKEFGDIKALYAQKSKVDFDLQEARVTVKELKQQSDNLQSKIEDILIRKSK